MLQLFRWAGKLKTIRRTGWVNNGIRDAESVADHTFRVAFMAMMLAGEMGLDPLKLVQMSLIHDLAETKVGDITPFCGVSKTEKRRREQIALEELLKDIDEGVAWLALWNEYEDQHTAEAVAVRNIDKLEMAIQAVEYSSGYPDKDLQAFVSAAGSHIWLPVISDLLDDLIDSSGNKK